MGWRFFFSFVIYGKKQKIACGSTLSLDIVLQQSATRIRCIVTTTANCIVTICVVIEETESNRLTFIFFCYIQKKPKITCGSIAGYCAGTKCYSGTLCSNNEGYLSVSVAEKKLFNWGQLVSFFAFFFVIYRKSKK